MAITVKKFGGTPRSAYLERLQGWFFPDKGDEETAREAGTIFKGSAGHHSEYLFADFLLHPGHDRIAFGAAYFITGNSSLMRYFMPTVRANAVTPQAQTPALVSSPAPSG
jgi:hypothetical protein